MGTCIEVVKVKMVDSLLLVFASVPDGNSQNQTAVSEAQHLLSDFQHDHGRPTVISLYSG
jgi:hypothetical protein